MGLVAVGGSSDYEVAGFEPFVVAAAGGDEVGDVGASSVAMPFLHVVEFASVHGSAAFETSPVPNGHRQALGGVRQALLAA